VRNLGIVVLSAALAGCASTSSDITATYVSPVLYQSHDCQQLATEAQWVSARAAVLSSAQDSQRTKDQVAELAQVKGQMVAIEQASIAKKCNI
jgi:hypothetical protein